MEPVNQTPETLKTTRTDLMQVDPRNLVIEEGFNVRKEYGDIRSLALSIVSLGVQEPLIGYKKRGEDKFVVTDGHRRQRAIAYALERNAAGDAHFADLSKIQYIPVRTSSSDPLERLYIMAVTGEKKKSLTDLERADMYSRLIEMLVSTKGMKRGEAVKEIMENVGVSQATMYNILKLNELPEAIKESIAKGEISGSTVVTIVREIKDEKEQVEAVQAAIAHAKEAAEKDGGKTKATARNVKGLTAKTPMARLKEVREKLVENGVNNSRVELLVELMDALEQKKSVNKLLDLFI